MNRKQGLRFMPHVVLLDPYAHAVDGVENWERGCFAYQLGHPDGDLAPIEKEALGSPRAVVVDHEFDWEGDAPLRNAAAPLRDLRSARPRIDEIAPRGARPPPRHLQRHGPPGGGAPPARARGDGRRADAQFMRSSTTIDCSTSDFEITGGYNTIGFFAPDVRYRSGEELGSEVREFKSMVKTLHRAGIEVILDVVYNHTAEGNHLGPTFHFKGIDQSTYYRLVAEQPRYYFDYTGTGNTLNVRHPQVLALIMDSLRYWASEMHVDGFSLRSRLRPGPAAPRRGPALQLLHPDSPVPRAQRGEADRRALGRRPRRISSR